VNGKAVYGVAAVVAIGAFGAAVNYARRPEVCRQADRARATLVSPEYLRPDLDAELPAKMGAVVGQFKHNMAAMAIASLDARCAQALAE